MAPIIKFTEIIITILIALNGCVLCTFLITFVILSIPVYIFRYIVIHLAKSWRPDLDEILDVQSGIITNDYFSGKTPRSNAILTVYIQGHVTTEEIRSHILKTWIDSRDEETGKLLYKKFQQYPERWLGFIFWKNGTDTFSIENHVQKIYGEEKCVTEKEIDTELEKLLNRQFPRNQSPWYFHVIENYKNSESSPKSQHQSVVIFTVHHCLSDGYGILTAVMDGFYKQSTQTRARIVEPKIQSRSLWQKTCENASVFAKAFYELGYILPQQYSGAPWLIPDRKKKWHQIIARADPILLQDFKAIKNKFGGSLTSILMSAVSAATYKMLEKNSSSGRKVKSMLCLSSLRVPGVNKMVTLSNNVTGAICEIPTTKMLGPVQRLRKVDQIVEKNKTSGVPIALKYFSILMGSHFYFVSKALTANKSVPMGLTNFSVPMPLNFNGKPVIRSETIAGGLQGDVGITIAAQSYGNEVRIGVSAEAGIMSQEELKQFVKFFTLEIRSLHQLTQRQNL